MLIYVIKFSIWQLLKRYLPRNLTAIWFIVGIRWDVVEIELSCQIISSSSWTNGFSTDYWELLNENNEVIDNFNGILLMLLSGRTIQSEQTLTKMTTQIIASGMAITRKGNPEIQWHTIIIRLRVYPNLAIILHWLQTWLTQKKMCG